MYFQGEAYIFRRALRVLIGQTYGIVASSDKL
jgi:hypothetical protein